jgi:hypothetical protein
MNEPIQASRPEPALSGSIMQEKSCINEYRPSRKELLREYNINIRFFSMGCVIDVGCKSIPFSTIEEGMNALNEYVKDPYTSRKIWEERILKEQ